MMQLELEKQINFYKSFNVLNQTKNKSIFSGQNYNNKYLLLLKLNEQKKFMNLYFYFERLETK